MLASGWPFAAAVSAFAQKPRASACASGRMKCAEPAAATVSTRMSASASSVCGEAVKGLMANAGKLRLLVTISVFVAAIGRAYGAHHTLTTR